MMNNGGFIGWQWCFGHAGDLLAGGRSVELASFFTAKGYRGAIQLSLPVGRNRCPLAGPPQPLLTQRRKGGRKGREERHLELARSFAAFALKRRDVDAGNRVFS
jgi:hypothetical protein